MCAWSKPEALLSLRGEKQLGRNDLLTRQQPHSAEARGKEGGREGGLLPPVEGLLCHPKSACAPGCALPVRPLGPYGSEHSSGATQERSVEGQAHGLLVAGQWHTVVPASVSEFEIL